MTPGDPGVLDASSVAFVQGRVSVLVGTRDAALRPHLVRGVGVRVLPDEGVLRLMLGGRQSEQVLRDLRAGSPVAVVFSRPSTHRTLQFKAGSARIEAPDDEDRACARRYVHLFSAELAELGFPGAFSRTLLGGADDLVVVRVVPEQAYDQTPGPQAGAPLGGAA